MFSIENGATLTIIDSSSQQTGEIYINAYMIDPYAHRIKRYTTRDIFNVSDGNLVIYGGTYQAGRSKAQSDDDLFSKIETVVGNAVALATDIAGYATGINAATGAYEDAVFNAQQALDAIKKAGGNFDGDESAKTQQAADTKKKDGSDAKPEAKKDTPDGKENSDSSRNKTVSEKQDDKDKNKKNESNKNGSAQYDGNSKIAAAENAITDAAVNKDKIGSMVSSAFNLAKSIKSCFETNESSIVIQSFLGTVVNVGNGGTFVSYGGKYIGYGMTPNIRNAVVESTQQGKVYIYDGLFEGRCGANIFNIVKYNNNLQTVTQYVEGTNGNVTEHTAQMKQDETNGLEVLSMVNKTDKNGNIIYEDGKPVKVPVNTENIRVRGGTFRCYYEGIMLGLNKDTSEGANDHNSDQMSVFPGSSGGVNLGVESYNEDLIKDGRIQLVDSYGDGALVLMDDNKDAGDKSIFHYRLFCTDEELRRNRYLSVYPNEPGSNSTYSFSLQTRYDGQDASSFDDVSKFWSDSSENDRGVFSSDEKFFTYPINDMNLSEKYYVIPYMTNTDVFGQNLDTSEVWYYNTPTDTRGRKINSFTQGGTYVTGLKKYNGETYAMTRHQHDLSDSDWKKVEGQFVSGSVNIYNRTYNYRNNVKWITYKVYKVDPLTRRNITNVYGVDQPVVTVRYGAESDKALKCRLPLNELGISYKAGEMYRVVMDVEEYLSYNGTDVKLDTASCESSIVFMCYDTNEYKIVNKQKVEDFTPVQWLNEPAAGSTAKVQIVNGQAGLIDYQKRKIFDVYYQWYEKNPDGPDKLIAGTDNIYTRKLDTFTADLNGLKSHNFRQMLPGIDDYTYINTVNPNDPKADTYDDNGLPSDTSKWTVDMLHAYTESDTPLLTLTKNTELALSPSNNKTMATNTDSCYIPQSCEGKTIYCKVTAVNNFWLRNFDHVQVFYSHPVTVPYVTKPLVVSLSATHNGNYATAANPVSVKITDIKGLDPDERITKIVYRTDNGVRRTKTVEFNATSADSIKAVSFPKDFDDKNYVTEVRACPDLSIYAEIYTNKNRFCKTNVETVDYEVEAQDIDFDYHSYYFYEGIYHHIDDPFVNEVSLKVTPSYASVGYSLTEGGSFTSSDPEVATFDTKGQLIPGTKEGKTTITVTTPTGAEKTLVYANPIRNIEVTGIDAPVVGHKFDLTADVPAGSNYKVKEVYWTEKSWGDRLPADAVAEAFRSYTAHVVFEENDGYEFMTDDYKYWVNGNYEHFVNIPYSMTVNLEDGSEDTVTGYLHGDDDNVWKANRRNTVSTLYSFPASSGGQKDYIDTISINYPCEVNQGESVEDWMKQIEIVTGAEGTYETKVFTGTTTRSSDLWEALGYYSKENKIFLKGSQTGFSIQLTIPNDLAVTFADKKADMTVIINGEERDDVELMLTSKFISIGTYNSLTVNDGSEIRPEPIMNVNNTNMVVGESICVNDLLNTNEPNLEFRLSDKDESTEYYDYYADNNILVAKKTTTESTAAFSGYVMWDINGDGIAETKINRSTKIDIYASDDDLPENDQAKVTFRAINPDGTQAYSVNRYVTHEAETDTKSSTQYFSIPEIENAVISKTECSLGEYTSANPSLVYKYGVNRINTSKIRSNRTYTIYTIPADSIRIHPGKDVVYAGFDENPSGIFISIDGEHFYDGGYIGDLLPDTEYTLYYKQGIDGTIYSKQFRTASFDYGVAVGNVTVTDLNTGNLERDGWQYDPTEHKLTLRNYTCENPGTIAKVEKFLGYEIVDHNAMIRSDGDLTIELIGENRITKLKSSAMLDIGIYCDGNITLTGNGDLYLSGYSDNTISTRGILSENGNVYLKSNGKVYVEKFATAISLGTNNLDSRTVYYYSGEYFYKPLYMTNYSTPFYNGGFLDSSFDFNIDNKTHVIKVYTGENGFDETLASDEDTVSAAKTHAEFIHIQPVHTCTKKIESAEYFVEGNCVDGATYYKSCSCGYTDKKYTFTVGGGEHSFTYYPEKKPTCTEDGWNAYKVCKKCGYTNFEAIPATGHQFVHHEALEPTCTEPGHYAYDECTVCGMTTYAEIPAKGHNLVHHEAKAPTCTSVGWDAYDSCTDCDYTTYHELPMTDHNLVHHDGKPATDTEDGWEPYDECTECSYTTFKKIPMTKAFANVSTISAETVVVGTKVTLTAKAEGGTAPYTYALMYKKASSSTWLKIGEKYTAVSTGSFKPGSAVPYDIMINVKDSTGKIKSKTFKLNVTAGATALENNSVISADTVVKGAKVTLTAKAAGGTAPYTYALMYKKASSSTWLKIGEKYTTVSTGSFKPGSAVPYDIMINVKDSTGKIKSKTFKLNVTAADTALKNTSSISAGSVAKGTKVTITASAQGGTAPYTYTMQYKKKSSSTWLTIGTENTSETSGSFKPGSAVPYEVQVIVMDSKGNKDTKTFDLTVS